jgi:xanthosine utilization system XapX-like protein
MVLRWARSAKATPSEKKQVPWGWQVEAPPAQPIASLLGILGVLVARSRVVVIAAIVLC